MNSEIELRPDAEHVKFEVSRHRYLSCLLEIELIKIILQIVILISLKEIHHWVRDCVCPRTDANIKAKTKIPATARNQTLVIQAVV